MLLFFGGSQGFAPTTGSSAPTAAQAIRGLLADAEIDASSFERQRSQLLETWKQIREGGEESVGLNSEPFAKYIDTSGLTRKPNSRRLEEDPLADGYPIYVDGWNPTYVPRAVIDGFASQMVFSFPLEQSGATIGVDESSVRIPLESLLQGGYARKVGSTGEAESGLTNVMWMQNIDSILTDRAVVAWAGKEHTVLSNGVAWDDTNKDQLLASRRSLSGRTEALALTTGVPIPAGQVEGTPLEPLAGSWVSGERITTLRDIAEGISGATNWAYEVTDASIDLGHLEQVREYTQVEGGEAGVDEKLASPEYTALSADATGMALGGAGRTGVKSEQLCLHLEAADGLKLNAEEKYFELPLHKNLVALRGQVSASPMRVFRVLTGTLVATLSPSGTELLLYMTFSSQAYVPMSADPAANAGLAPMALYLGPVDGKTASTTDYPVPGTDGRSTEHIAEPSKLRYQLYQVLQQIPVDYVRFWKPHEELCPSERVERMSTVFEEGGAAWAALVNRTSGKYERGLKVANELLYNLAVGGVLFFNVNCAGNFLRGHPNGGNGYEQLEMTVFGHFLFEIPWWIIPETTSKDWWDDGITPSTDCDVISKRCERAHDDAVEAAKA